MGACMSDSRGGTRWRRSVVLFVLAMLVVGLLTLGTLGGVIPLRLSVTGQDVKITSNGAPIQTPGGLAMYPTQVRMKDGTQQVTVLAGLPEARLPKGMCVSVMLTFPVLGSNTFRLKSTRETTIEQMTLSADALRATDAKLVPSTETGKPVAIGRDASDLGGIPKGPAGTFGIDAPGAGQMSDLRATAQGAVISGTAALAGLGVKVAHGRGPENGECFGGLDDR